LLKIIRRLIQRGRRTDESAAEPVRENDYRAVSIIASKTSCRDAQRIRGKPFLTRDAPRLPLPSCAQPDRCPCRYRKHPDRRIKDRRDVFASSRWYDGKERRRSVGRRATDKLHSRIEIQ
jgi:hypothetical protein